MRRRLRAAAFLAAALACAAAAAAIANGHRTGVQGQFGELRSVVVAGTELAPRERIRPRNLKRLEVRRVPDAFVPPDAIASPEEAVGLEPATPVPAGSYLIASQLRPPGAGKRPRHRRLGRGRAPVEIAVTGAEALGAAGPSPEGSRVDVVVTTEPGPGSRGRTRVAARGVELLALGRGGGGDADADGIGAGGEWSATLALTRSQALRLIQAENFARQVRLMPHLERR